MIQIYDANAYLRSDLHRSDGIAHLSPRFIYEAVNASPHTQFWVWDGPNNNERRRSIFPGYKIRDYTGQENIFEGLKLYREVLDHSKAIQIEVPNWEADDVCYTLAKKFTADHTPVTIFTNDFDFFQMTTDPLITLRGVRAVEGVPARYVSLFKALRGDSSDKIPGLSGFGIKSWLSFRDLYEPLDQAMRLRDAEAVRAMPFKPAQRAWLADEDNIDLLFDFYQITVMLSVPEDEIAEHTRLGVPNPNAANAIFTRFML